ncbi:hypothetical protein LEP1GSC162_1197 [Leptospira santarosai str. CBC1531]|nr:hypothetical protein LEP1GSC162_1197 [Leptospira santarosai str. CBC1531]
MAPIWARTLEYIGEEERERNERIFFNFFTGTGDFFRGGDIPISI